jgi:hypothetical protein
MASTFDGVEDAKVFESSAKMNPGFWYDLEVVRITERKAGQGVGMIVPVEFQVLATNDPNTSIGSAVSWVPKQSHGHAFLSNLKAFVLACMGMETNTDNLASLNGRDPKDPQGRSYIKAILENAISEANALAGYRVRCQTTGATTKGSRQPFVVHRFVPLAA